MSETRLFGYGSLALAGAAAVVLAIGGQAPWLLRLGIVAALVAVLLTGYLTLRDRRSDGEPRSAHPGERDHQDQLAALQSEVRALRDSLQALTGGQLLVERVSVQAQSTRVRSLPEQRGMVVHPSVPAQSTGPAVTGPRHGNGARPVDELLAANGGSAVPRHRRRREP